MALPQTQAAAQIHKAPHALNIDFGPRLSPAEAAIYLGVEENTLGKWRSTGKHKIPYYKLGSGNRAAIRYDRADLDAFLARSRIEA